MKTFFFLFIFFLKGFISNGQENANEVFNGKWVINKIKSDIGNSKFYIFPERYEVKLAKDTVYIVATRVDSIGKSEIDSSVYPIGNSVKQTVGKYHYDVKADWTDHPGYNVVFEEKSEAGEVVYRMTNHWHAGNNKDEITVYRTREVANVKVTLVTVYDRMR